VCVSSVAFRVFLGDLQPRTCSDIRSRFSQWTRSPGPYPHDGRVDGRERTPLGPCVVCGATWIREVCKLLHISPAVVEPRGSSRWREMSSAVAALASRARALISASTGARDLTPSGEMGYRRPAASGWGWRGTPRQPWRRSQPVPGLLANSTISLGRRQQDGAARSAAREIPADRPPCREKLQRATAIRSTPRSFCCIASRALSCCNGGRLRVPLLSEHESCCPAPSAHDE
jgi:hypothetical protein